MNNWALFYYFFMPSFKVIVIWKQYHKHIGWSIERRVPPALWTRYCYFLYILQQLRRHHCWWLCPQCIIRAVLSDWSLIYVWTVPSEIREIKWNLSPFKGENYGKRGIRYYENTEPLKKYKNRKCTNHGTQPPPLLPHLSTPASPPPPSPHPYLPRPPPPRPQHTPRPMPSDNSYQE